MNQKTIAMAAVLMAAVLTAIFATSPLAYAGGDGDSSETSTDQEVKQKNVGSGDSNNNNCAENLIDSEGQGGSPNDCTDNNQPSE
jgi:hypothetical protein